MTEKEYLLTCLIEECAEVQQRATKALRFGLREIQPEQELTNQHRLVDELDDLEGVLDMLRMKGVVPMRPDGLAVRAKIEKIEKFMRYSRCECGTLQ